MVSSSTPAFSPPKPHLPDYILVHSNGTTRYSSKKPKRPENGLVTGDGSVFQIDGNLGILAGVNEMMLQSRYLDR